MSNSAVGNVYQRVIQEVIDASQMDFQDSGVDPVILDQLREVWQQKLSALSVASFPWDPPPPAPPAPEPEPAKEPTPPPKEKEKEKEKEREKEREREKEEEKKIKAEPGSPPPPPPPPGQPLTDPSIAAARAAQHVQNKFGSAVVKQQPSSGPGTPASGGLMLPGKPQPSSQPQANGSGLGSSQTDGAGDDLQALDLHDAYREDVIISRLDADGAIERVVAEGNLMRAQESALRAALEDLRFQSQSSVLSSTSGSGNKRSSWRNKGKGVSTSSTLGNLVETNTFASSTSLIPSMRQTDGPDEDMDDEDAINSDLDDPEDDPVDDDDEAEGVVPQIMLCMYDKVQRTKNKWKCVLKDGVLTVNGKEYVFHKATGEYEW